MSIKRPQTPPLSYLMTPPSTGSVRKRVRFYEAENIGVGDNMSSRHLANSTGGESPDDFFEEPQEGSDTEIRESTEDEGTPSADNTAPSSPASNIAITPKRTMFEKHNPLASLTLATSAPRTTTTPFPLMSLPISIRKRIYEHLLVIPGLICVRQRHTSFHDEKKAFLYPERRHFLPGIAYALAQLTVDGFKMRFSQFATTNINILCVSKEVFSEAKAVLYGKNSFEIMRPTNELCPPPDYSVRLFPTGCQRLVTNLSIRVRTFYDLHWLLKGGYNDLKNYYRALNELYLILEIDSAGKGFGKHWSRKEGEKWIVYIERLRGEMAKELLRKMKTANTKVVPTWMNLRVLFSGESYDEEVPGSGNALAGAAVEQAKRNELRQALVETWELFKKGGKSCGVLALGGR
ncbi:hypothetical protein BDW02DRAFT_581514 [Decorospora gaudefroyi]|uniref:F-box domain-containing protein n=1 Tax=Decorospora gaudefroyi TaxID=184978 RepID=A0A6A5KCL6_9PLEO|nr:hypothetical protein BDW02DRAFT_581514 [Decorospora gaudefroyi]